MIKAIYAIIPDKNVLEIESEVLDPAALMPGEVLVEAETTVISAGTELANFTALSDTVFKPGYWNTYPWRPGYGLVGRIVAEGGDVGGWKVGDRIFCFGKHASFQIIDTSDRSVFRSLFALDPDLSAERAALIRMGLVAFTGPQVSDFEADDTVAVFGLGLVGNLAAQLYQLAGARVIGLDPNPGRCQIARSCGLSEVLKVEPQEQVTAVKELTAGKGAQITVDAVGHSAVIQNCVQACVSFGQVILLGSPRAPFQTNMTEVFSEIHLRWLTVRGALEWRLPPYPVPGVKHSVLSNIQRLTAYIRDGRLDVDSAITHIIKPEDLCKSYLGLLNNKEHYCGVIVDWREATKDGREQP